MLGAAAATDGEYTSAMQVGVILGFNAIVAGIQLATVAQGRRMLGTPLAMLWNVPHGDQIPVAQPLYSDITAPTQAQPNSAYAADVPIGAASASPVPPPPPPNTPRSSFSESPPTGDSVATPDSTQLSPAASATSPTHSVGRALAETRPASRSSESPQGGMPVSSRADSTAAGGGATPFTSFLQQFGNESSGPATVVPYSGHEEGGGVGITAAGDDQTLNPPLRAAEDSPGAVAPSMGPTEDEGHHTGENFVDDPSTTTDSRLGIV